MRYALLSSMMLVLIVSGCGAPTHDSIMKDSVAKMKELNATLATIKDEASAKAAVPKLKEQAEQLKALKKQQDALPKLSADEEKKLADKHLSEIAPVMSTLLAEYMRVLQIPAAAAVLADTLKDLDVK